MEESMGFLDRFFNKPTEPSITRRAVPGLAGSMTAHQAWAVIAPAAKALDPHASLTLITSGLDMDHKGCSRTWELIFFLRKRNATLMLCVEPDHENSDIDKAQCILTQRIHPASSLDAQRPVFPDNFRDSPEVVAEFSANGVDFVAGPSDMKLEGRMLPSGDAVWVTYYWDQEHSTSFKEAGS
jgi:hypothetical protein